VSSVRFPLDCVGINKLTVRAEFDPLEAPQGSGPAPRVRQHLSEKHAFPLNGAPTLTPGNRFFAQTLRPPQTSSEPAARPCQWIERWQPRPAWQKIFALVL
jgi:hypothetical protein